MRRSTSNPAIPGPLRRWLVGSVALAALLVAAPAAHADPVQFASFQITSGNPFSFTDNVTSDTLSASTQVLFDFAAPTGLGTADRAATLTLTGTTTSPASSATIGNQTYLGELINGPAELTITENSTGRLLLSMDFTGSLAGLAGGPNANLLGASDNGDTVLFSSSYLASFGSTGNSYNLSMPTVTPVLSIGSNGFLSTFTSNINGSFVANITAVPQPASLLMFGTGMAATLALAHRARRRRLAGGVRA